MPWCNGVVGHEMEQGDKFCSQCGESPTTQCENGHPLRPKKWQNLDPGGGVIEEGEARPEFCTDCGGTYPWTTTEGPRRPRRGAT